MSRSEHLVPRDTPKRHKGRPGSVADNIITARQQKVVRLRTRKGWSIREIAEHLDVSQATVQADLQAVMLSARSEMTELIEVERQSSMARIERGIKRTMVQLGHEDPKIVLEAARTLVLLETRAARLLGLDAPERTITAVAQISEESQTPERAAQLMRRHFGVGAAAATVTTEGTTVTE